MFSWPKKNVAILEQSLFKNVFGPEAKFPFAPKRKYTPCDAPKEKLRELHQLLGFDRTVIVQATCHDTDNRALVDALVTSDGNAKGVAFVDESYSDDQLKELDKQVRARVVAAAEFAENSPEPPPEELYTDVLVGAY